MISKRETLFSLCQKVKYSAIMPNVVSMRRQFGSRHIGNEPNGFRRYGTHSFLGVLDSRSGDVQNRDVEVPFVNQIVDESGFAAAHIDNRRRTITRDAFDQG